MADLALDSTVRLNDGVELPLLGFGTYQIPSGGSCERAVARALEVGYRHIDTAALYGNEADVGRAVRASGLRRSHLFVTTKLWNSDHGYETALKAFDKSLSRLGLDYIDLYLIHWPEPGKRLDSWRALVEIKRQGRARSIGVSNYTIAHLDELARHSKVIPAVNQVELSPFLSQQKLRQFCAAKSIRLMAYCPLTRGDKLNHPVVSALSARHAKTSAQILLRWAIQHAMAAIPKSVRSERIAENAALYDFALDAGDMARLDALNQDYRTCWDPTRVR